MNKTEFIKAMAEKAGATQKEATAAYEAFVATVVDGLKKEGNVALVGFGTFALKTKAACEKRNPATGKTVKVAACKAPSFKIGKAFKGLFN